MHVGLHGKRGEGTGDVHCSEYVVHGGLGGSGGCLGVLKTFHYIPRSVIYIKTSWSIDKTLF